MPSPNGRNHSSPASFTPTGQPSKDRPEAVAQSGDFLTTAQGVRVPDTDHSLKAGERGPTLLEDFHLREKITHFDHERIPERVVHARGAAAHGIFESYGTGRSVTKAGFLASKGLQTEVFVRFSTVLGSRGSADTVRDTRGFAVKFYTTEGNFDLVGNNMPVFFIQDGIKSPDFIHAAKPHPDLEIPGSQSAHDTFWDFASLHTEATHHVMWNMSDRGIPRSYRTMEGFGIHTFRLISAKGKTTLVKFHWKPVAGKASLVWEEAQKLGGIDPDFHRRDLWDAIEAGAYPEWDFGIQVLPDDDDQTFEGIDLLDATKLVPEELAPVQIIGRLTLNRNPTNYFAETEQVAFCTAHVPRGVDFTDDPLLQARNFSYLDTQLTRLGGPNFDQLAINRPRSDVNTNQRDGFGQQAIHRGVAAYSPNSINGGCPFHMGDEGFIHVARQASGAKVRQRPQSFDDHFTQASLFWNSMSEIERDHIVGAFVFELSHVEREEIRARMVASLANVDPDLAGRVAGALGLTAPKARPDRSAGASEALSQLPEAPGSIAGRVVGVFAADGLDSGFKTFRAGLEWACASVAVSAQRGGAIANGNAKVPVDKLVT